MLLARPIVAVALLAASLLALAGCPGGGAPGPGPRPLVPPRVSAGAP